MSCYLRLQYMEEIQIGVALLVLLAMQEFLLTQACCKSHLAIYCLWIKDNHLTLIGIIDTYTSSFLLFQILFFQYQRQVCHGHSLNHAQTIHSSLVFIFSLFFLIFFGLYATSVIYLLAKFRFQVVVDNLFQQSSVQKGFNR